MRRTKGGRTVQGRKRESEAADLKVAKLTDETEVQGETTGARSLDLQQSRQGRTGKQGVPDGVMAQGWPAVTVGHCGS